VEGSCLHNDEPLSSVKVGKFFDNLVETLSAQTSQGP
jgi:hypothetical protein